MEVLSSRVLVRPTDFERSFRFYAESLGLQGFYAPLVHCGRCGRYLDGLHGYISVMRANEGCCQVICRG